MRPNFLSILVLFVLVNSCDTEGGGGGEFGPEMPELKVLEPSLKNQGSGVVESDLKRVDTSFRLDSFSLLTEDAYSLTAKLAYLESVSGSRPGIIMMHEFGVWVNPWVGSALLKQLVAESYVCLGRNWL